MPGSPFGGVGSASLPGGGGRYLTYGLDANNKPVPARHVVMIASLTFRPPNPNPAAKSRTGTVIESFQILKTDTTNHKVGAEYDRVYNLDKILALGNTAMDLAAFRSIALQKPVSPSELTPEMTEAAYGLRAIDETSDPEVFAAGYTTYRGMVVTAVCWNKPTQRGQDFTACTFVTPTPQDLEGLEHLFGSESAEGEQTAG
jgi:hypothetical protein